MSKNEVEGPIIAPQCIISKYVCFIHGSVLCLPWLKWCKPKKRQFLNIADFKSDKTINLP